MVAEGGRSAHVGAECLSAASARIRTLLEEIGGEKGEHSHTRRERKAAEEDATFFVLVVCAPLAGVSDPPVTGGDIADASFVLLEHAFPRQRGLQQRPRGENQLRKHG